MLDPLTALGLTANIIQLINFVRNTLNDANEIYKSGTGTSVRYLELEAVSYRLSQLMTSLRNQIPSKQENGAWNKSEFYDHQISDADKQLLTLVTQAVEISDQLESLLRRLRTRTEGRWHSVRQAVKSAWKDSEIIALEDRLHKVREEIQTNILVSMRQAFETLHQKSDNQRKEFDQQAARTNQSLDQLLTMSNDVPKVARKHGQLDYAVATGSSEASRKLTQALLSAIISGDEAQLRQTNISTIIDLLDFETMSDRQRTISRAHSQTFEWIYAWNKMAPKDRAHCHDFHDWLESDETIYWITGKPGAGKSTLMRFLSEEQRTVTIARIWAQTCRAQRLRMGSFFFWISGNALQKSKEGMLRTLILQLITTHDVLHRTELSEPEILAELFETRMRRCEAFGADFRSLSMTELTEALDKLLSRKNECFLLFIDGLDEFQGETIQGQNDEIINLVKSWAEYPSVKLCVASRFWTAFADAFHTQPKLRIEYLTRRDIQHYVDDHFAESRQFTKLEIVNRGEAQHLKHTIVKKAQGVFLWVYVVVRNLKDGMRDGDDLAFIHDRLDDMPAELEELFDRIFRELEPRYYKQASQIFQFFRKHPDESSLLAIDLSFMPLKYVLEHSVKAMSKEGAQFRADCMKLKLFSRCKCFLDVEEPSEPGSKIRYLHRTARDYLESPAAWNRVMSYAPDYDADQALFPQS